MRFYDVEVAVRTGIDGSIMQVGTVRVKAESVRVARMLASQEAMEWPEYDERIDPRVEVLAVRDV